MKTSGRNAMISAAATLAAALLAAACGYTLVGKTSTLPPSIRVFRFLTLSN